MRNFVLFHFALLLVMVTVYSCGDGSVKTYYDGNIVNEHYFEKELENGTKVKHGLYKKFDPKGNLRDSVTYNMGKKHGTHVRYYENGVVSEKCTYVEGTPDGKCIEQDDQEQVRKLVEYANGVQHGVERTFNAKGTLLTEQFWKKGLKDSTLQEWDEKGVLKRVLHYKDGKKHGEEKSWCLAEDKAEVVAEHRTWEEDKRQGKETYYSCLDGKISSILNWTDDMMDGDFIYWENGKKIVEEFVMGTKLEK
jgi:antitoxin component YwqK of YwqJK toxin-antitoxin module